MAIIKRKKADMTVGALKQMIREEIKSMLKDGTIRLEMDLDSGGYDNYLEAKIDVYVGNDWVTDTKSEVYFKGD